MKDTYVFSIGGILALITGLALMLYYLPRYHSNPLEVTPKFVKRAYFCLICTYGVVFFVLLKGLKAIAQLGIGGGASEWMSSSLKLGIGLFGGTLLVYAIPVLIGLGMKKHSSALKLSKFLRTCYIAYFVLFLASFIATLTLSPLRNRAFDFLMTVICGAIIFVAPILSVYRMKTVIKYVDQRDMVAIKKWELFFVFEALTQLMQMAIFLIRILLVLCCCGGGSVGEDKKEK